VTKKKWAKKAPSLCPICKKNPISTPRVKRCRACYYERTGIKSVAKVKRCIDCDKVISPYSSRCRVCHFQHVADQRKIERQALQEARIEAAPEIKEPLASYEEAQKQWDRCIGRMKARQKSIPKKPKGRERVVIIPDVHAPFHEPEFLAHICHLEGPRSTKAICVGDISDAYAFSTFTKYEHVSFGEEWASVTQVIDALSRSFHSVEIIIGNHDARLEKRLRERLTSDMVDAIRYMTGGLLCPLTALAKQYPNVTIARHETPSGHQIDWFTTDGDVWIGHPEKFSTIPGGALRKLEDWLLDNEISLGLDTYKLIVMGHTHQLSKLPWRGNQLLVECGCLCQTQGYQTKPRIGGRPQKRGYVWYESDNGTVDLNSVGMHWFDVEAR
jgi:predicted phosphodiesterase